MWWLCDGRVTWKVDHDLTRMTKERIIDGGIGVDLVCLTEQPLHAVPLFRVRERERERLNNLYLSPPSVLPENYIWWSRVLPHSPLDQLQFLQPSPILEPVPIPTSITNLRPLGMHGDHPLIHISFQLISDSPFQINIHLNRGECRTKGTKLYNSFSGWTFLELHISDLAIITTWHIASLVCHICISGIFLLSIQAMKMNYFCWYKLVPVW